MRVDRGARGAVLLCGSASIVLMIACGDDAARLEEQTRRVTYTFFPPGRSCDLTDVAAPSPMTFGDHLASRIQVQAYPFMLDTLRYTVEGYLEDFPDFYCNNTLSHRVRAYVIDQAEFDLEGRPPSDPQAVFETLVDPGDPDTPSKEMVVRVSPPVRVESGTELIVSVEMVGSPSAWLCVRNCPQIGDLAGTHAFWSYSPTPPYPWLTILESGLNYGALVEAEGLIPE